MAKPKTPKEQSTECKRCEKLQEKIDTLYEKIEAMKQPKKQPTEEEQEKRKQMLEERRKAKQEEQAKQKEKEDELENLKKQNTLLKNKMLEKFGVEVEV
jgi:TolA-binding protein